MKVKFFIYIAVVGGVALGMVGLAGAMEIATQGDAPAGSGSLATITSVELPQDLLVAAYCDDFKWRAGRAISQVEAAHEVMDDKLAEFDMLGANFRLSDFVDSPAGLRSQAEGVCAATDTEQAQARIDQFRSSAEQVRGQFAGISGRIQSALEQYVEANEAQIRSAMEEEMKAEVADLEAEAYARLEAKLRAEAEQRKEEMKARIQKEVEAELMAEFGGQENPDIEYLMQLGEQRGRARGEAEGKLVEAELRAKYEGLADEEVEKLKAAGEEKAREREAEMKQFYSEWANAAGEINIRSEEIYQENWAKFREQALESRKAVTVHMVRAYYSQARTVIQNNSQLVEQADDWARDRYGLQTTAELLAQLDADEQKTLAELADVTEASGSQIAAFEKKFGQRWNELRERMNSLLAIAPDQLFSRLDRALERRASGYSAVEAYLESALGTIDKHRQSYARMVDKCNANPDLIDGEGGTKYDCAACRARAEHTALVDYGEQVQAQIKDCQGIIANLDAMRPAVMSGARPLVDAVAAANQLEACLTGLRAMHDPYVAAVKLYERRRDGQVYPCEQANR
jgi:hypothetical protein